MQRGRALQTLALWKRPTHKRIGYEVTLDWDLDPPLVKYPFPLAREQDFSGATVIIPDVGQAIFKSGPKDRRPMCPDALGLKSMLDAHLLLTDMLSCSELCLRCCDGSGAGPVYKCSFCLCAWHQPCCSSLREGHAAGLVQTIFEVTDGGRAPDCLDATLFCDMCRAVFRIA